MHDHPQPFTDPEDIKLEKRFKDLESNCSDKQEIEQGLPSLDDLESLKASVGKMHDHPQPFTDPEDIKIEKRFKDLESNSSTENYIRDSDSEQLKQLQSFQESIKKKNEFYSAMDNKQLPGACNDSAVVESTNLAGLESINNPDLDTNISIEVLDKFYNILHDLLLNHAGHLSTGQFKILFTIFFGTFIVTMCKKNIHVTQDSSEQSKSQKESSRSRDAINTIASGNSILSQSYIDSVKNISVNMNTNNIDIIHKHPHLTRNHPPNFPALEGEALFSNA